MPMTPDRFDELVGDALDLVPEELAAAMDNVVVLVEPRHDDQAAVLQRQRDLVEEPLVAVRQHDPSLRAPQLARHSQLLVRAAHDRVVLALQHLERARGVHPHLAAAGHRGGGVLGRAAGVVEAGDGAQLLVGEVELAAGAPGRAGRGGVGQRHAVPLGKGRSGAGRRRGHR